MRCFVLALAVLACLATQGIAQQGPPSDGSQPKAQTKAEARQSEYKAAIAAADAAAVNGPKDIKLADEGVLRLPEGTQWVPRAEADRLLQSVGQRPDPSLLGMISGETDKHGWTAILRTTHEGYVKDEDAKDLDPAKLLANLREGQEEANKSRIERGFPPLTLDDWMQPPSYDPQTKRLVWALPVRSGDDPKPTINYNTRALGRKGYLSLNLLTDKDHFQAEKGTALALLQRMDYVPGQRYADFNPSTDKVAAYGLAALVGAVALKKLGLFAIAAAFLAKFAKIGIIAVIGFFAAIKAFFSRRKRG